MKKIINKLISGILTASMLFCACSVTAFAVDIHPPNDPDPGEPIIANSISNESSTDTTTVQFTMDSGWTASIPAYINPSEHGNADVEKYSVTVSDVVLGNSATLVGAVEYDGTLIDSNDIELGYVLCDEDGEVVTNTEIIFMDAGSPDATTSYKFGAELNENPKYAGNYLGTATFNFVANERVFTIGKTNPENVIAKFNEDYSQVNIFTAGNDSDGIMRDFNGDSPMQNQASKLETAIIEDGITTIGSRAFNECSKLTNVTIPDTVTSIADDSFNDCDSLNTVYGSFGSVAEEWANDNGISFISTNVYTAEDIENDEHLFAIGKTKPEYVVAEFSDDFTEVNIFANGKNSDGKMKDFTYGGRLNTAALMNNSSLKKVNIGNGVYSVSGSCFYSCDTLVDVNIKGVVSIDEYAFGACTSLKSINIPNSVTSLGDGAFSACSSLKSIVIPDSVTEIGDGAFGGCDSLSNVILSNNIKAINNRTFSGCTSLENIVLPNSVTSIGNSAFLSCSSLKNINIPNGVATIGTQAFTSTALTEVTIPDTVTAIEERTFYDCQSLEKVVLPNNINTIGKLAFYMCYALVDINIPNSVTSIGSEAFSGCIALKEVIIPDGVTTIEDETFNNCQSLNKVIIPDSVTSIGKSAFNLCKSLTEINIPNSVTSIESEAFTYCSALSKITIGSGMTNIAGNTFYKCSNLKTIYGHAGTYAETWANDNGYTFVAID